MTFDPEQLAQQLRENCPRIGFAFLHGSAKEGTVRPGGDIDVAVYFDGKPTWDDYEAILRQVEPLAPEVRWDLGMLNSADPVYRFEALKGRLLFARDMESYLRFFSLTCREYESQMASYERQRQYRLEAMQQG
jgi:predicted nucleotidyltransferase